MITTTMTVMIVIIKATINAITSNSYLIKLYNAGTWVQQAHSPVEVFATSACILPAIRDHQARATLQEKLVGGLFKTRT